MAKGILAKPVRKVEDGDKRSGDATTDGTPSVYPADADGSDPSTVRPANEHAANVGDVAQRADVSPVDPLFAYKVENLPEGGNTHDYIILIEGVGPVDEGKAGASRAVHALFDIGHTIKTAHIVSRVRGREFIRIERE